jgi:hypothetical protein
MKHGSRLGLTSEQQADKMRKRGEDFKSRRVNCNLQSEGFLEGRVNLGEGQEAIICIVNHHVEASDGAEWRQGRSMSRQVERSNFRHRRMGIVEPSKRRPWTCRITGTDARLIP